MSARNLQLDFGPCEHFRVLHGSHRLPIYVAVQQDAWHEQRVDNEHGAFLMETLANTGTDAYVTANAYKPFAASRSVSNVAALTSVYVDLDYHRVPHLAHLSPDRLLDRVIESFPSLPLPTFTMASGRGMWLLWRFTKELPQSQMPRWQRLEREMVTLLRPFGADYAATDAARLSRIAGSVNTRNGRNVGMGQVGDLVTLAELERAVSRLRPAPRLVSSATLPKQSPGTRKSSGKRQGLRPYVLHRDRLTDLRTLVGLRGGRLTEHRRRMLYVAACSLAWYCGSVDAMERELLAFASENFHEPHRYGPGLVRTVMQRMARDLPLTGHLYTAPGRYRLRSSTIVNELEITPAEQRELQTIITRPEKNRRRAEKRLALGMTPREALVARATERALQAREMRARGMTQAAIAAALGVSQPAVCQLLKRS